MPQQYRTMNMNKDITTETLLYPDSDSDSGGGGADPESEKLQVLCDDARSDDEEEGDGVSDMVLEDIMLSYILDKDHQQQKTLSPPLNDNSEYHVFFIYHHNDRSWVLNVMERLEMPTLGFKCCCLERDFEPKTTLTSKVRYGLKNSLKTIIVLSSDFVSDTWQNTESPLISDVDLIMCHKDLVVAVLQDCDVPSAFADLLFIDANDEDWWSRLLAQLTFSEHQRISGSNGVARNGGTLMGLNPNLQSGHLLTSLKSRCRCCGREVIDPRRVPEELVAHGIHIPPEEYAEAVTHLMDDAKFRCHVWCYNVPAALLFFVLLLALCLAVVPVVERGTAWGRKETGLELLHAGIVWLCVLTAYMIVIHIAKKKMKLNSYKRLSVVNTMLVKYNILCGLENLGMADCNKYYLHFFYFEIGPCLAFLQELMMRIEEARNCFSGQPGDTGDVTIEIGDEEGDNMGNNDQSRVLESANITNASLQVQAEDLIIQHSGEYISLLITKKLDRPRHSRHVDDHPCLCQFVEHRVYKKCPS